MGAGHEDAQNIFQKMRQMKSYLKNYFKESSELNPLVAKYQGTGDNDRIEKITYKENEQRIYINKDKYFEGVPPEVWNYYIGAYQVLRKYLKDRKGRSLDDAPHYCRIVTSIAKTIQIQREIDAIYPEVEKTLIDIE